MTKTSIVISVSFPSSDPVRGQAFDRLYQAGIGTWQAEVNDAGGIYGRKIVLKKVDNKGTAGGAIAACKEEMSNGSFVSLSIVGLEAETDCVDAAGHSEINSYGVRTSPGWHHSKSVVLLLGFGARIAEYVRGPLGWGNTKVGVIWVDDSTMEQNFKGFAARSSEIGLHVVDVEKVAAGQQSYLSQLSRLRSKGTQTLVLVAGIESATMLRDLKAMGWQPNLTGTFITDELSSSSEEFLKGLRGVRWFATADSAAYHRYQATAKKYGTNAYPLSTALPIYGYGLVLGKVLQAAGPNLTQQSFEAALNSAIKGYDAGGIFAPFSWDPNRAFGAQGSFPVVCCNSDRTWKGNGPPRNQF